MSIYCSLHFVILTKACAQPFGKVSVQEGLAEVVKAEFSRSRLNRVLEKFLECFHVHQLNLPRQLLARADGAARIAGVRVFYRYPLGKRFLFWHHGCCYLLLISKMRGTDWRLLSKSAGAGWAGLCFLSLYVCHHPGCVSRRKSTLHIVEVRKFQKSAGKGT